MFGVPEGSHELVVGYTFGDDPIYEIGWRIWMPEGGVIPRLPVELELVY